MRKIILKSVKIEIDILFFIIAFFTLCGGYIREFIITFISICLHEIGHILMSKLSGYKINTLKILPMGLYVIIDETAYKKNNRIGIYLSGPVTNILLSVAGHIFCHYGNSYTNYDKYFVLTNIYLAIFNLIPIIPLDGGKILREILSQKVGIFLAVKYLRKISLILSFILIIIGGSLFYRNFNYFTILLIGLYIFFLKIDETEAAVMNVKQVFYRHSRLLKMGVYPARDLVVLKSVRMNEVLKCIDFDRFHIIHVLDENLRLIKTFTEQEIIDGMVNYSSDITFEEFIQKSE